MSTPPDRPLDRKDVGPVTVMRINAPMLRGDQDSDELFDRLVDLVENTDRRKIVLDVGAIQYFASAALGKLVSLNRKARQAEARMVLCNVTPTVARILEVTHLADVLVSYNDEDEAVRSFS